MYRRPARPDLSYGLEFDHEHAFAEVESALTHERGNASAAARRLGVPERTLQRWLGKHERLRLARAAAYWAPGGGKDSEHAT